MLSKIVNAQLPHARAVTGLEPPPLGRMTRGGLWVGGRLTVDEARVCFAPNGLNRALHRGGLSHEIPVAEITGVAVERALVTQIVAITRGDGSVFRVRCYGARALAADIARTAGLPT